MRHTIHVEGGPSFTVSDEEPNLLRGALRAGVGFPHECSVGGCGACRFELVEGEMASLWDGAPGLNEKDRRRGKRLACQSRPKSDCRVRARVSEAYQPRVAPRRLAAVLTGRRALTGELGELTFRTEAPAEFLPGQYALFELPGVAGPRAYSMSNLGNPDGVWQFIVRRVPGGAGSTALLDLAVGDGVALDGPYGHAYLRPDSAREVVCIAGGSGLAPMLSVARGAAVGASARRVTFLHGVRAVGELCARPLLEALPGFGERLRFHPVVSSPPAAEGDDGWTGARGFVHQQLAVVLERPFVEHDFYFAGPPPMIDAVQRLLMGEHQVPFEQLHFDRFV